MEYREFRADNISADDEGRMSGLGAPFNSTTTIGDLRRGGWVEEIAKGAFAKALREGDTVLLCDHDMSKPLARMSAGTLRLRETDEGLSFDADTAPTSYEKDLRINIRAGNKGGMSIGFRPVKEDWFTEDGQPSNRKVGYRRVLREVALPELSCVTNPAYRKTNVSARDDSAALLEERQAAADAEPPADERTMSEIWDANEGFQRSFELILDMIFEDRAGSVSAADRKSLAGKGHALPDGSYPIPDIAHLHAAAILAASHHGDWKAAKELIRRRARELGVNADSLPGMGMNDGDKPPANRDDPDGKEYEAIDTALRQLKAGDTKGAEKTLAANQAQRAQEPDASTPDEDDDPDVALRIREAERSRELDV